MNRLRVLLLAPDCNPEAVSMPYVTYSHAAAHAHLHDVTLVIGTPSEAPVRRANAPFKTIEVIRMPLIERMFAWCFRTFLKSNFDTQMLTVIYYPLSLAFEWYAWRHLRRRIFAGDWDVVLRVMPMSPVLPSPFSFFLRNGPIPFVLGPLNGGLPWPPGFTALKNQREWVSSLRNLYRYMPFARSTYRYAAAIIAASSQTYSEFTSYRDKLFFVPEPGIGPSSFAESLRAEGPAVKLELIFVGGLVPRKACDIALRASAPLLRSGVAHFTVIGDGPERGRLEELARSLAIEKEVTFRGWLDHKEVFNGLRSSDLFVFPTLRDNGAGVVFEALASGAVPVVVDFGGPGDIVHEDVGRKVALTNEDDVVAQLEKILAELAQNPALIEQLRRRGIEYARECLTWEAKARSVTRVLEWVTHRAPKPDMPPPKLLAASRGSR